jgi:protein arginine N-methyltransferase 1
VTENGPIEAYAGFFDTQFNGSPQNPTDMPVTLSTAPDPTGATHWGQQSFFLHPAVEARAGDKVRVEFEMRRQRENHRLMEVTLKHKVADKEGEERVSHFLIE